MSATARTWLRENPVPPNGTEELEQWRHDCLALGRASAIEMLESLRTGDDAEQYAALMGLRVFGYDVTGEGYDDDFHYIVRAPGSATDATVTPVSATKEPLS